MPEYEQINLKLKPEEYNIWKAESEKLGIGMTQFIRNCVNRTISGDNNAKIDVNLDRENRKLDTLARSQATMIEMLQQLLVSAEKQKNIKGKMAEIAINDVDNALIVKVLDNLKAKSPASAKNIAQAIKESEMKVLEALVVLENDGKVKRNFLTRPNTFEVVP